MASARLAAEERRLAEQGLGWIEPEQGLSALGGAIAGGAAQIAVWPIDWRRYAVRAGDAGSPRLLDRLVAAAKSEMAGTPRVQEPKLSDHLIDHWHIHHRSRRRK